MVLYTCEICLKQFNKKSNFIDHTENKKKPCKPNPPILHQEPPILHQNTPVIQENYLEDTNTNTNNTCLYCGSSFSRKDTLKRHINSRCKIKKQKDEESQKEKDFLLTQVMELKKLLENQNKEIQNQNKEIQELKKKKPVSKLVINANNTNNTLNTGTINTNSNNNITLMAHGKEDFSKIGLKSVIECLCSENFQDIVPSMVKHIYIDKSHPEFHNFKVLDLARNKSEYYDGKDWVVGKADDGILKIFENANTVLTEPFDKHNIDKTIKFIKNNEEFKKKYQWIDWSKNYCVNLFKDTDKEYTDDRNKILNELKLIFYNYKDQILAS